MLFFFSHMRTGVGWGGHRFIKHLVLSSLLASISLAVFFFQRCGGKKNTKGLGSLHGRPKAFSSCCKGSSAWQGSPRRKAVPTAERDVYWGKAVRGMVDSLQSNHLLMGQRMALLTHSFLSICSHHCSDTLAFSPSAYKCINVVITQAYIGT